MLLESEHPLLQIGKFLFRFDRFVDFRHGVRASKDYPMSLQAIIYNKQSRTKSQGTSKWIIYPDRPHIFAPGDENIMLG